jgi:hypothetical protein
MWIIQETGVPNAALPPDIYVRSVAANSSVVSYWRKINGNLAAPNQHNDLHFTLGVIMGDTAHFHATWHGNGTVSYYTCRADPNNGTLATAYNAADPQNAGPNGAQATAQAIALYIYRPVYIDPAEFKKAREKLMASQRTQLKVGKRLLGSALKSSGISKPKDFLNKPKK